METMELKSISVREGIYLSPYTVDGLDRLEGDDNSEADEELDIGLFDTLLLSEPLSGEEEGVLFMNGFRFVDMQLEAVQKTLLCGIKKRRGIRNSFFG